jgi:gamma-glutamylcyclotransferase
MPSDYKHSLLDLWYFAYGSNLDVDRKKDRTGAIREARIAKLSGYRLAFNKRGTNGDVYANLLPNPTEEVYGVIYRCTLEALVELDYHEGVSSGHYRQETVQVQTLDGQTLHAIAYVANPQYIIPESPPSDEYLGHILRGARSHGLSPSVIRSIEIRAGRRAYEPGKRLWRTYQVDAELRDEWLCELNSLKVFQLISICQGHESSRANHPSSLPHIHLRLSPERVPLATSMIFGGASNSFPIPEASTQEALGIWTLEYRRRVRLVPAQEFAGGRLDDLVVRIQPSRRFTDESDRKWINQWFEIVIPEVQNYDSKFAKMHGG